MSAQRTGLIFRPDARIVGISTFGFFMSLVFQSWSSSNTLRRLRAVNPDFAEMRGESLTTFGQPLLGNNEEQYATGFQPAIRVTQEHLFGATTIARTQGPIIGWLQIQEAKTLDWALRFQGISLYEVGNPLPGWFSSIGIKLNTVAKHLNTVGDNVERHAIAHAWVDRGRWSIWKPEESANLLGFRQW